ncbi:MAG: hypothetical protein ACF8XB_00895 [Planctomycetota bacterium JB042]
MKLFPSLFGVRPASYRVRVRFGEGVYLEPLRVEGDESRPARFSTRGSAHRAADAVGQLLIGLRAGTPPEDRTDVGSLEVEVDRVHEPPNLYERKFDIQVARLRALVSRGG